MNEYQDVIFSAPALNDQSMQSYEKGQQPIKGILKKRLQFRLSQDTTKKQHKNDVHEDDVNEPEESLNLSSERLRNEDYISPNINNQFKQPQLSRNLSADNIYLTDKYNQSDELENYSIDKAELSQIRIFGGRKVLLPESPQTLMAESSIPTGNLLNVWKRKSFQIIYHITKFCKQLKTHASLFRFRLITKEIIQLIGDKAGDSDEIMHLKQLHNREVEELELSRSVLMLNIKDILFRAQKCLSRTIPIFEPDGLFMLRWNTVVVILIIINIFYIPMKLSFDFNSSNQGQTSTLFLQTIPTWFLIVDILLNFNTAYYNQGMIHTKRKEILNHYLGGNFGWDLAIIIPFMISYFQIPYTDFALLLRAIRLKSMLENLEEAFNLKFQIQAIFDLTKSILFIIFVSHMVACGWHYLGEIQITVYGSSDSWLIYYQIQDEPWASKYVYSFYFSIVTTLTIGYGDICPKSNAERVFVMLVSLIVCGVLGYTISSIGEIFRNMMEKQQHFKAQMKFINQYLKQKNVNKELQVKIRKYFEYFFKIESRRNAEGERLIGQLTKKLKEELHVDLYGGFLNKSRIIRQNLSEKNIKDLSSCVREFTYAPEEEIFVQGDKASRLFYILHGEVVVFAQQTQDKNKETILNMIDSGNFIGEPEFATEGYYKYSLRANKFTTIAYINYEDFYKLIREDEQSLHRYCQMKDNLLYNPNFKSFGQTCEICEWTHPFTGCPFVFHQPNLGRIAKQFQTSEAQIRTKVKDRVSKKTLTQECALAYIINNNIMSQIDLSDNLLVSLGFKLESEASPQQSIKQSSIVPQNKHRQAGNPGNTSILQGESQMYFSQESEIQNVQKMEKPLFNYDMAAVVNDQSRISDPESFNSEGLISQPIQQRALLNILSRQKPRSNLIFDSNFHKVEDYLQPQLKESVSVRKKAVQFKLKPMNSSLNIQNKKAISPSRLRDSQQELFRKVDIQDIEPQYGSKQLSTRDFLINPILTTRRNVKKVSHLQQVSSQRLSLLLNEFENPQRNLDRKISQITYKSQTSNMTMGENQQIDQFVHNDADELDTRTNFYERTDYDIDKWLTNSEIYFPNFDLNIVIKILQAQYERNIQKLQTNKTRSTNPLNKFRSMIFKTTQINK